MANLDKDTVAGFGDEWQRFDQSVVEAQEMEATFREYFSVFPWDTLPVGAVGADFGCGSGRWAALVAPRVGHLHVVDASHEALDVARRNLADRSNVTFHDAPLDAVELDNGSLDFGYSLGVLHHIPDTLAAMRACVQKLKPGAPLLVYLYYRFDNRPAWYAYLWQLSELARRRISRLPHGARYAVSQLFAAGVYWPLARSAKLVETLGGSADNLPLSYYRDRSFYTMRTDALDRLGTRLEQRFTRVEIEAMMRDAGLEDVEFSDGTPYWCAVGRRRR